MRTFGGRHERDRYTCLGGIERIAFAYDVNAAESGIVDALQGPPGASGGCYSTLGII